MTLPANAHLTAISRRNMSAPAQWLHNSELILPRALDYGCGRGKDADELGIDRYDPHWFPSWPRLRDYRTILCTYVLNVLPDEHDRSVVVARLQSLLDPSGYAYVAVRRDSRNLCGYTAKGTWQGWIELPLHSVVCNSRFEIYRLRKTEKKYMLHYWGRGKLNERKPVEDHAHARAWLAGVSARLKVRGATLLAADVFGVNAGVYFLDTILL